MTTIRKRRNGSAKTISKRTKKECLNPLSRARLGTSDNSNNHDNNNDNNDHDTDIKLNRNKNVQLKNDLCDNDTDHDHDDKQSIINCAKIKQCESRIMNDNNTVTDNNTDTVTATHTPSISKADIKARELWHRKSGAGFHLFAMYYAGQPNGVVVVDHRNSNYSNNNNGKKLLPVVGQSRAAKKKRMKRLKLNSNNSNHNNTHHHLDSSTVNMNSTMTITNTTINSVKTDDDTSELLQILKHHPEYESLRIFFSHLSRPLPITFRIRQITRNNSSNNKNNDNNTNNYKNTNNTKSIQELCSNITSSFSSIIHPIFPNIFQSTPQSQLSKSSLGKKQPQLKELLVSSSMNGLLARQELGSMLPVLALIGGNHIQYGSKILDMCASPGSKTLQALEIVTTTAYHNNDNNINDDNNNNTNNYSHKKMGRVVANDIHPKRLISLQEAVKRSGMHPNITKRIVYTNHDASTFPTPKSGTLFDCILADVPCSGDGTIRKDKHILPGWMPNIGNALHNLQCRILKRALTLVKVNGVVVYSTCTFNPIENEAVVANAILWSNRTKNKMNSTSTTSTTTTSKPAVEILEWPTNVLPGFIRRKGVLTWRVADYQFDDNDFTTTNHDHHDDDDKNNNNKSFSQVKNTNENAYKTEEGDDEPKLHWYQSYPDAINGKMKHAVESMWPPSSLDTTTTNNNNNHDNISSSSSKDYLPLDRCTRLWPQDHDTGGFFVAILRKNRNF